MLFHLKGKEFKKFIGDMSKKIKIDADIIEKDYYVCTVLKEYQTVFNIQQNPLHKAGEIQIESTSFTVSEPTETHIIQPILYKYATNPEREILTSEFDIKPFEIKVQKLERIFVDKLFAAQLYFEKQMYIDLSKHLYDLTILFKTKRIQEFFDNAQEFKKIVEFKREEEIYRKGGVDKKLKIQNFGYFDAEYNEDMIEAFKLMQEKYIFKDEYRMTIGELRKTLEEIRKKTQLVLR